MTELETQNSELIPIREKPRHRRGFSSFPTQRVLFLAGEYAAQARVAHRPMRVAELRPVVAGELRRAVAVCACAILVVGLGTTGPALGARCLEDVRHVFSAFLSSSIDDDRTENPRKRRRKDLGSRESIRPIQKVQNHLDHHDLQWRSCHAQNCGSQPLRQGRRPSPGMPANRQIAPTRLGHRR